MTTSSDLARVDLALIVVFGVVAIGLVWQLMTWLDDRAQRRYEAAASRRIARRYRSRP